MKRLLKFFFVFTLLYLPTVSAQQDLDLIGALELVFGPQGFSGMMQNEYISYGAFLIFTYILFYSVCAAGLRNVSAFSGEGGLGLSKPGKMAAAAIAGMLTLGLFAAREQSMSTIRELFAPLGGFGAFLVGFIAFYAAYKSQTGETSTFDSGRIIFGLIAAAIALFFYSSLGQTPLAAAWGWLLLILAAFMGLFKLVTRHSGFTARDERHLERAENDLRQEERREVNEEEQMRRESVDDLRNTFEGVRGTWWHYRDLTRQYRVLKEMYEMVNHPQTLGGTTLKVLKRGYLKLNLVRGGIFEMTRITKREKKDIEEENQVNADNLKHFEKIKSTITSNITRIDAIEQIIIKAKAHANYHSNNSLQQLVSQLESEMTRLRDQHKDENTTEHYAKKLKHIGEKVQRLNEEILENIHRQTVELQLFQSNENKSHLQTIGDLIKNRAHLYRKKIDDLEEVITYERKLIAELERLEVLGRRVESMIK